MSLQSISTALAAHFKIEIDVYGFDTGNGLPEPVDFRDLPHVWARGFYTMDKQRLVARLTSAKLILGDIGDTLPVFLESITAPIGFVAFELDYYSSTRKGLEIFRCAQSKRLARVFCTFGSTIEPPRACYNDWVGELCAIREFNEASAERKLAPLPGLRWMRRFPARWNDAFYVFHDFRHPLYSQCLTPSMPRHSQMPLAA
jgi:hypothetical protein